MAYSTIAIFWSLLFVLPSYTAAANTNMESKQILPRQLNPVCYPATSNPGSKKMAEYCAADLVNAVDNNLCKMGPNQREMNVEGCGDTQVRIVTKGTRFFATSYSCNAIGKAAMEILQRCAQCATDFCPVAGEQIIFDQGHQVTVIVEGFSRPDMGPVSSGAPSPAAPTVSVTFQPSRTSWATWTPEWPTSTTNSAYYTTSTALPWDNLPWNSYSNTFNTFTTSSSVPPWDRSQWPTGNPPGPAQPAPSPSCIQLNGREYCAVNRK